MLFFSWLLVEIQLPEEKQEVCFVLVGRLVVLFRCLSVCTSLDYEIHTLRIGRAKGITKHENIFFKSRSTGLMYVSIYIQSRMRQFLLQCFLTQTLALALSHTHFYTRKIVFNIFPPIEFGVLNAYTLQHYVHIICIAIACTPNHSRSE